MKKRTLLRRVYVLALLVCHLLFPVNLVLDGIFFGSVIVLLGISIHFWSSGYLTKELALTTAGPYSIVRNPFYLSTLAVDCGFACMFSNPWLFLGYGLIAYLWVYKRRVGVEEEVLLAKFGESFTGYCSKVARIIPWFGLGSGQGSFSIANIQRHHELSRAVNHVALASGVVALYYVQSGIVIFIALPVSIYVISVACRRLFNI